MSKVDLVDLLNNTIRPATVSATSALVSCSRSAAMAMTVVDQARANPEVDALYLAVDAVSPITVTFVDGPYWSCGTQAGVTSIEFGTAKNPAAALFHELLHADFKNAGYRQHSRLYVTNDHARQLPSILEALDNELQHHRIYARFAAAGFPASAFYSDSDKSSFRDVRNELRKMKRSDSGADYLLKFLTVIGPGGHSSVEDRRKLRNFLFIKCGTQTEVALKAVEADIMAWGESSEMDPGLTLRSILQHLGFEGAWVGVTRDFPADGFFVGQPFQIADAESFIRSGFTKQPTLRSASRPRPF